MTTMASCIEIPLVFLVIPARSLLAIYPTELQHLLSQVVDFMPEMPKDFRGAPLKNLTVFVFPHSHDDTGWQRTVDQYYEEEVSFKFMHVQYYFFRKISF